MPDAISIPLSAAELQDAVRRARGFDPSRLDRILRHDAEGGLVEVQAGATWKALAERFRPGDAQAAGLPTTMATIGESIATNAAGPDGRPAVAHVESLALVTPDGELRRVSRTVHAELFALAVGGHGLFGAPYSVTLRIASLERAVSEALAGTPRVLPEAACPSRWVHVLVPPERVDAYLAEARTACDAWRLAVEAAEVRRTRQEEETFLRWARREFAEVSLRLGDWRALGGAVRTTQARHALIDAAIAHGGSFPIAFTPDATRAQTETCYPQLKRFLAEKRRLDPAGRLVNAWFFRQCAVLGREPCEVRWGP
jgi:FAD/FMN-containing dehydrogenase